MTDFQYLTLENALNLSTRFWAKVDKSSECWLWTGAKVSKGYGTIIDGKKQCVAHRLSFELTHGTRVPEGMQLDHLCRVRNCVNPTHLEVVTNAENTRRKVEYYREHIRPTLTHCSNGHELSDDNTFITTKGTRRCRTCRRAEWKRHRKKRREKS